MLEYSHNKLATIRSLGREAARRAGIAMTGIPITMNSTRLTSKKAQILLNRLMQGQFSK
jgi:hypothetical protein